jgi:hypothetical protein
MTIDVATRFWAKVHKLDGEDACWEWTAAMFTASGYGCFGYQGKPQGAHRVSWILSNGPIPDGLWVLHRCDNRKCVRPLHLFLGTAVDNARDMTAKGRNVPPTGDAHWMRQLKGAQAGVANHNAKLNETTVAEVKVALVTGEGPSSLARRFGVKPASISLILSGQNWGHVPWPEDAAFPVDRGRRSRGIRASKLGATGGVCATDGCGVSTTGGREHCDGCWAVRRRESKREHAKDARAKARTAA